jgi:hypothetical protein
LIFSSTIIGSQTTNSPEERAAILLWLWYGTIQLLGMKQLEYLFCLPKEMLTTCSPHEFFPKRSDNSLEVSPIT